MRLGVWSKGSDKLDRLVINIRKYFFSKQVSGTCVKSVGELNWGVPLQETSEVNHRNDFTTGILSRLRMSPVLLQVDELDEVSHSDPNENETHRESGQTQDHLNHKTLIMIWTTVIKVLKWVLNQYCIRVLYLHRILHVRNHSVSENEAGVVLQSLLTANREESQNVLE